MENYHNQVYTSLTNQNCSHVEIGIHSKVFYDGQEVHGTISYEDVQKYIKIGIFQNGDSNEECLVIRNEYIKGGNLGEFSLGMSGIRYIHLENGVELLRYEYFRGITENTRKNIKPLVSVSQKYELLEEKNFSDILLYFDQVHSEYSVKDLLALYKKYTLEFSDKEKQPVKVL